MMSVNGLIVVTSSRRLFVYLVVATSMASFVQDGNGCAPKSFAPEFASQKRVFPRDLNGVEPLAALQSVVGEGISFRVTDRNEGAVITHIYTVQTLKGKDVINAVGNMNVGRNGEVKLDVFVVKSGKML